MTMLLSHRTLMPSSASVAASRLRRCCLLALGSFALAQAVGTAAQAQNCGDYAPTPLPPATQADINVAGGVYNTDRPLVVRGNGASGCGGREGFAGDFPNGKGGLGQAGGAGASFSATYGNQFGNIFVQSGDPSVGALAYVSAAGGSGGGGGLSDAVNRSSVFGGDGGAAGAGGTVVLSFDGNIQPGTVAALGTGLRVDVSGGNGGGGGPNDPFNGDATRDRIGGDGAAGAAGGRLTFTMSTGSIEANSNSAFFLARGGAGGSGGQGATDFLPTAAKGGLSAPGAAGGTISATFGAGAHLTAGEALVYMDAGGGAGGSGGRATGTLDRQSIGAVGADGSDGGRGGSATLVFQGQGDVPILPNPGFHEVISLSANGGNGGSGGPVNGAFNESGGEGGVGGAAGSAALNFSGRVSITDPFDFQGGGTGLLVQANGGLGGRGAAADDFALGGYGGNGGAAGDGGTASLGIGQSGTTTSLEVEGEGFVGAIVQSVGGGGGDGGSATGIINSAGGVGAGGGNGGFVLVEAPSGLIVTRGDRADAMIAQSVGGGGGVGGDATNYAVAASQALGGNGGTGGNGGRVDVNIGAAATFASTSTQGGHGVLAQSIGGAGGVGGSANVQGAAIFSLGVGGNGRTGGAAGPVTVDSAGLLTTYGDHATGIEAQSVGGGGGNGGTAVVFVGGVGSAAVAVGGSGGTGGTGGAVTAGSSGQVSTFGPDAFGIRAQSVGGGGGNGGAATATALSISPHPDVPSVSVAVALGGSGGSGNTASAATANNTGVVSTAGHSSIGIQAQSLGGGGGTGGDATASAYAFGRSEVNLTVSTAVGGNGGSGGDGGGATATSSGLVYTIGQDASGLYAQSVGGGGGTGGNGDATATAGEAANSMGVSISVGGTGGAGGLGGGASATNTGTLGTMGDGADGIFVQSVGGGGGDGNGGVASANAGTVTVAVGVGGSGGSGNHGGSATARNEGVVVTTGSAAMGMVAQSVGGGGGTGGKGSTSLGGAASAVSQAETMATSLENNYGAGENATKVTEDVFRVAEGVESAWGTANSTYQQMTAANPPEGGSAPTVAQSVSIGVAVGGSGNAGGNGGAASATNTGEIQTHGDLSDGVWVQSVGGGGGIGGASATSQSEAETNSLSVSVGRGGGGAGTGGAVTATNATGATIETFGDLSFGLAAQSVGGSGGRGGLSAASSKVLTSLSVAVSGTGNGGGQGGDVTVTNAGSVSTEGINAMGIFAQSVGGGGGLATVSTIDTGAVSDGAGPDTATGLIVDLTFGSVGSSTTGAGGDVQVTSGGSISTIGQGGVGILAQSVGGGGGYLAGAQPELTASSFVTNGSRGDGGDIRLDVGGPVTTTGVMADAIWATSIGGGGGLITATGSGGNIIRDPSSLGAGANHDGDGGDVTVNLTGAQVSASGFGSNGITAWSFGGGASAWSELSGSLGGAGAGGDVTVSLTNSTVDAPKLIGIYAYSDGGTGGSPAGNVSITIDSASRVATQLGVGIKAVSEGSITIANAGTIDSGRPGVSDGAVNWSSPSPVTITNTGTMVGGVYRVDRRPAGPGFASAAEPAALDAATPAGAAMIYNLEGGMMTGAPDYELGAGGVFYNEGTLEVGATGETDATRIAGDLEQYRTGVVRFDLDAVAGEADHATVEGVATLDGEFDVVPVTLLPGAGAEILTAGDGVTISDSFATSEGHLFTHKASVDGTTLSFATTGADFTTDGAGTDDRESLAGHLQDVWDAGGEGFATGFAALAAVEDADGYAAALNALSAGSVAAVGYARFESSRWHAQAAGSCPEGEDASVARTAVGCVWFQVRGSTLERDAQGDDPGFDYDAVTTTLGGQAALDNGLVLGGVVGWEESWLSDDADQTDVDGSALLGSVALTRESGPLTLRGAVSLGTGSFDSTRRVDFAGTEEVAEADSNARSAGLHLRAAYEVPRGTWTLQPAIDLDLVHVSLGDYVEEGAGEFNLDVEDSHATILSATPSLRVGRRVELGNGRVLDAFATGGVSLLAGEDFNTTASFVGAPNGAGDFTTSIDNPNALGRLGAGVSFEATDRVNLRLQYDGSFADGQTEHAAQLRVTYEF